MDGINFLMTKPATSAHYDIIISVIAAAVAGALPWEIPLIEHAVRLYSRSVPYSSKTEKYSKNPDPPNEHTTQAGRVEIVRLSSQNLTSRF